MKNAKEGMESGRMTSKMLWEGAKNVSIWTVIISPQPKLLHVPYATNDQSNNNAPMEVAKVEICFSCFI